MTDPSPTPTVGCLSHFLFCERHIGRSEPLYVRLPDGSIAAVATASFKHGCGVLLTLSETTPLEKK